MPDTIAAHPLNASLGTVSPAALEIDRVAITLRLAAPARFHFHHGGSLMGLMCDALGTHDLPDGLVPFACESGQVRFEAGDTYKIGVTLIGECRSLLDQLLDGLRRVGANPLAADSEPTGNFQRGFEVLGMTRLPPVYIEAEAAMLARHQHLTLRFVSPTRVARPDGLRVAGRSHLNGDCFPAPHFLDRVLNRVARLLYGQHLSPTERRLLCPDPAAVTAHLDHLVWLDVPVPGRADQNNTRKKGITVGGMLGTIRLSNLPPEWLPWLVSGSLLHVGESLHFGLGAYRLCAPDVPLSEGFAPSRTLLSRVADAGALKHAFEHVRERSHAAGVDGESTAAFEGKEEEEVARLSRELGDGSYTPEPLVGFMSRKSNSHVRALAVPAVRDRVAQRAACELLGPSLDTILEDCAFAYRKGFSRQGAARAIEFAYEQGFRYVLDADITSFFDAVEWKRLFSRLHALFPFEPLVELLKAWVRAPVIFEGRRIERRRGLPQGTAISPLLANLFLDEFDEELLGEHYRLVRYADDFVVLCKDARDAERARDDARQALEHLGLSLNDEKTSVRSIDAGFTYLGYLFCGSVAIDKDPQPATPPHEIVPDDVPAASWLAQVPFEAVRAIAPGMLGPKPAAQKVPLQTPEDDNEIRRPLYVFSIEPRLMLRDSVLIVERPSEPPERYPIRTIAHLVVSQRSRMTVPLLLQLNRLNVPVYFCTRTGALIASVTPKDPDWPLWMAQARTAADPQACLGFAREIVAAKLHNAAALAVRFRLAGTADTANALRHAERQANGAPDLGTLLGYEGAGGAAYFKALGASLGPEWQFDGRVKRPPTDPVNSMLSFGYHILYNHAATALGVAGLNPRLGLFHKPRGTHQALASDLVEEFRHLIDSAVWAMIQRREVKPADFVRPADEGQGTFMTDDFRKAFITAVERRILTVFSPGGSATMTYRAFLDRQAAQLARYVSGKSPRYEPLRLRA